MTKNEFLDIMGEIDENIIDSTLDVSRRDGLAIPYKRPSAFKNVLYAAACIALVAAAGFGLRYLNGMALLSNDEPSDSTSVINIGSSSANGSSDGDFVRGWNPDAIRSGDPMVGGSAVISTAELDGINVSLILHDITKLPGEEYSANGHDYTDYWGARDIVLYAKYNSGEKAAYEHITPHSDGGAEFIHDKCLVDGGTRILKTGPDNKAAHVIMQYADYDAEKDALIARYFTPLSMYAIHDKDENGISKYGLFPFVIDGIDRIGGWKYGYQVSEGFYRKDGAAFADPEFGYEIFFDTPWKARVAYYEEGFEGYDDLTEVTGWDPEKLKFDPDPEAGESAIVSTATVDDLTVSLILYNVIKRPGEDHFIYSGDKWKNMWVADNIYLYAKDGSGRKLMWSMPTPNSAEYAKGIPADCIFEGSTRLLKTVSDGKERYLLIQCYKSEGGERLSHFIDIDMARYDESSSRDENGVCTTEVIRPFSVYRSGEWYSSIYGSPVSESFALKEGTTFVDPVYGYEITFDIKRGMATAAYTNG